jgi:Di-haem oxidoreductase, putative peroxidase
VCTLSARLWAIALSTAFMLPLSGELANAKADKKSEPYAVGYFGEPLGGLSEAERAAFDRGLALFVRRWDEGAGFARNANSCVSCHSIPMPGGSGMSEQAGVNVRVGLNGTEVLQRQSGATSDAIDRSAAEVRRTPPLFGLGFIEYAAERAQSGLQRAIFGALAEYNSLRSVIERAFATELGVSSVSSCARVRNDEPYPKRCEPTISERELGDVVTFVRYLAPPPRRGNGSPEGAALFQKIGCAKCHTASITTTLDAPEPLRDTQVTAYTDLGVHNLGYEWPVRTTPLWGLNSFGPPYMHDASASNIEDAIIKHRGEGLISTMSYRALSSAEKERLLAFLKAL